MGTRGLAGRRLTRFTAVTAVALCVFTGVQALARPDLERARERADRLEIQMGSARTRAGRIQLRILALANDLQRARASLDRTRARSIAARHALSDAREDLDEARTRLAERARSAFMTMGPAGSAAYLLGAESFADLMDRTSMLGRFQEADTALALDVADRSARLARSADELEGAAAGRARLLERIEARRGELLAALTAQQDELARLAGVHADVSSRVHRIERRIALRSGALPFGDWAARFLDLIGAPDCHDNMVVMLAWQANEFTEARWNPLATTHRMPGSTSFNSVGVQHFRSLRQGLRATEETLTGGAESYGYAAILQGLRTCAGSMVTAEAIRASAWCRGCSLGGYVTTLIPIVEEYFESYAVKHA